MHGVWLMLLQNFEAFFFLVSCSPAFIQFQSTNNNNDKREVIPQSVLGFCAAITIHMIFVHFFFCWLYSTWFRQSKNEQHIKIESDAMNLEQLQDVQKFFFSVYCSTVQKPYTNSFSAEFHKICALSNIFCCCSPITLFSLFLLFFTPVALFRGLYECF